MDNTFNTCTVSSTHPLGNLMPTITAPCDVVITAKPLELVSVVTVADILQAYKLWVC